LSSSTTPTASRWGNLTAIGRRVEEHWAAGADHVCIQALDGEEATPARPDERLLAALSSAAAATR